jgi:general secretion pathway protein G
MKDAPLDYSSATRSAPGSPVWVLVIFLPLALIVLAVIVPEFYRTPGTIDRVNRINANSDQSVLSTALDDFRKDCGRYPTAAEGLDALYRRPAGVANWQGRYAVKRFVDPWGKSYVYVPPPTAEGSNYQIVSAGRDGAVGTADDVVAVGPEIKFRP